MKTFTISLMIVLGSSFAYAHDKEKSLADQKKDSLQMVDDKMAALQTAKTCFSAATDKDAVEKCHKDLWKAMKKCDKMCHCNHEKKDKDKDNE